MRVLRAHNMNSTVLILPRTSRFTAMTKISHKTALSDICPGSQFSLRKKHPIYSRQAHLALTHISIGPQRKQHLLRR